MRDWFAAIYREVRTAITDPVEELSRVQRRVRYLWELGKYCYRELMQDRAEEMAAALTFRLVFSLVPLFVLGLVVLRAFGGIETVQGQLFGFFGIPEVENRYVVVEQETVEQAKAEQQRIERLEEQAATRPEPAPAVEAVAAEEEEERAANLRGVLTELIAGIDRMDFGSLGVAGIGLFIYAAMMLAVSLEDNFNTIFKAPKGRPISHRIAVYWSVITLGSTLLGLSLYLTSEVLGWVRTHAELGVLLAVLSRLAALAASWVMLFLLYLLFPNTRVRLKPALVGALLAAVAWEASKYGFQVYVTTFVPYAKFYGALGLIPLFLFWVYLSWMIVLFGLELTYALQMMKGRWRQASSPAEPTPPNPHCAEVFEPRWLVPIMATVGRSFRDGSTATVEQVAGDTSLPVRAVAQVCERLAETRLLNRVPGSGDSDPGYALAMPPERVAILRVLEVGQELSPGDPEAKGVLGRATMDRLADAEAKAAAGLTLADVLDEPLAPAELEEQPPETDPDPAPAENKTRGLLRLWPFGRS